jgi:hypothetical protein
MIPNTGNLAETAPIKLLLAMDEQSQTGILYFRKNDILKVFYLNQGKISWAISSDEEDKIEHVLLAKKLVSPEALAPFLAGNKIGESFGKILVENGLISLETLINASREQLKRIATSVMFWNSGNYQLEPESPPTRLVSLELEIVPLVYNYVLAHMDVNIIWEEIGSLSGELQQVPVAEKIFQFNLDDEQQEVFAYFREPQRPENVLLRFPAERKHAVLKILYFLLITGLLIKKEADALPSLDFNELDSLFGHDQPETQAAKAKVDIPAMINEADIKDIPQLDFPEISEPQAITEVTLPELPDPVPQIAAKPKNRTGEIPHPAQAEKKAIRITPLLQEKPKSRWLSMTIISLLLTGAVVAVFLWLNRTPKFAEPEPAPRRPVVQPGRKTPAAPATVQAEPQADPEAAAQLGRKTAGETAAEPAIEKKETAPALALPVNAADARQAFASGKFSDAGDLWRREMASDKIAFSILLEMDCLEESVNSAYQQLIDKENFFILKRVKGGRTCWLVLWGKFRTQNEAAESLKLVPEYFFKQSEPPSIIELEPYL